MDVILGVALLKKQWIIQERYDDVKIKLENGAMIVRNG